MDELSKFDELRFKTDKELWKLLNDDVELGLTAACEALKRTDLSSVVLAYSKVKRAHTEVSRLLPLAYEIPLADRARLQLRLNRLSRMLEALHDFDSDLRPSNEDASASAALAGC